MICKKCGETGVYNEVRGKGFYYCRTCKDEIPLEESPSMPPYPPEWDVDWDELDKLTQGSGPLRGTAKIKLDPPPDTFMQVWQTCGCIFCSSARNRKANRD